MTYWLVKTEPLEYSWSQFVVEKNCAWTGVRNYQARNFLQAMMLEDIVLIYHSNQEKAIVGISKVIKTHYTDPTFVEQKKNIWSAVVITALQSLVEPVTLETIKEDTVLCQMKMVKNSRLSVIPVQPIEFSRILFLSQTSFQIL